MKSHKLLAAAMAAAVTRSAAFAFRSLDSPRRPPPSASSRGGSTLRSSSSSSTATLLLATKRPNDKGFGRKKKYSIDDKSYGGRSNGEGGDRTLSGDDSSAGMADFFAAYSEWEPLFRGILLGGGGGSDDDDGTSRGRADAAASAAMAHPILMPPDRCGDGTPDDGDLWGMSTLERRNPWRLLPSKPTSPSSLRALSLFLDEWQRSLLDIPLDEVMTGINDRHFLEEGRRTIAVTRFHVLDEEYQHRELADGDDDDDDYEDDGGGGRVVGRCQNYDWETELFRTCWSELAHLTYQDVGGTGSLVLLPDRDGVFDPDGGGRSRQLEVVGDFVERNLIRPMRWLGRDSDWEIVAMERGGVAVRLLYKLGEIPDIDR
jgi:hypothetical protein